MCKSLDGDADRLLVYLLVRPKDNKIDLVDGDKMMSLCAHWFIQFNSFD